MLAGDPTGGMAPGLVQALTQILAGINRRRTTILLVEQTRQPALAPSLRLQVTHCSEIPRGICPRRAPGSRPPAVPVKRPRGRRVVEMALSRQPAVRHTSAKAQSKKT
jgi:hypothetical protein